MENGRAAFSWRPLLLAFMLGNLHCILVAMAFTGGMGGLSVWALGQPNRTPLEPPRNKTCDFQELQKMGVELEGVKQSVAGLAEAAKAELKTGWEELKGVKQDVLGLAEAAKAELKTGWQELRKELGQEKEAKQAQQRFCPWDTRHSAFIEAGADVDFGRGQVACMDAIVYGYDLVFERHSLWRKMKWLGTSMQQDPNDAIIIQEMLWRVKPDVLIELGTNTGGGALYFASIMSLISPRGRVITIDPNDFHQPWAPGITCTDENPCLPPDLNPLWKERVTFIQGVPTDPQIVEKVRNLLTEMNATTVMVSEDSNHFYEVALENARVYAPFVTKGSYLLIQDTKMTRWGKSAECGKLETDAEQDACWGRVKNGPLDSVHDFLAENPDFAVDRSLEYLIYTQHAGGFLKRVR